MNTVRKLSIYTMVLVSLLMSVLMITPGFNATSREELESDETIDLKIASLDEALWSVDLAEEEIMEVTEDLTAFNKELEGIAARESSPEMTLSELAEMKSRLEILKHRGRFWLNFEIVDSSGYEYLEMTANDLVVTIDESDEGMETQKSLIAGYEVDISQIEQDFFMPASDMMMNLQQDHEQVTIMIMGLNQIVISGDSNPAVLMIARMQLDMYMTIQTQIRDQIARLTEQIMVWEEQIMDLENMVFEAVSQYQIFFQTNSESLEQLTMINRYLDDIPMRFEELLDELNMQLDEALMGQSALEKAVMNSIRQDMMTIRAPVRT